MSTLKVPRSKLELLLERACNRFPTPAEIEEHRRSFAYGNAALENPAITRELIDRVADRKQKANL